MRSGNCTLGLLGAAALAATGCTTAQSASEERPSPTASAQDKSQQAMERAVDAQKRASDLEQASQSAQSKVAEKQRDLADAQAEAQAARERAADAQKSANIQREQANNQAETAQADALKFPKTKPPSDTAQLGASGWRQLIVYRVIQELKANGVSESAINQRGLVIRTTINRHAQHAALVAINQTFAHLTKQQRNMKNALVAVDPKSGAVLKD